MNNFNEMMKKAQEMMQQQLAAYQQECMSKLQAEASKIENKVITEKEFINFIKVYANPQQKINEDLIETMLTTFIGEKLIQKEVEAFNIKLSDYRLLFLK